MVSFNTQRNKLSYVYNWSQINNVAIDKQKEIKLENENALSQAQKTITNLSKNRNFSTDWILLNLYGDVGKEVYYNFEAIIQNIPEEYINSIKTDVLFGSLEGTKTILQTAIYKTIQFEIEDLIRPGGTIPDPAYSIKNLKVSCSLLMIGQDILEGLYVKFLCYLYPLNEIVK